MKRAGCKDTRSGARPSPLHERRNILRRRYTGSAGGRGPGPGVEGNGQDNHGHRPEPPVQELESGQRDHRGRGDQGDPEYNKARERAEGEASDDRL